MRRLLLAMVFSMAAGGAMGATYHVAPAPRGDDANPGTQEKPWASPERASEALKAGDTALLHEGVYRLERRVRFSASGAAGAWITLAGAPGEKAILDAEGLRPKNRREAGGLGAVHLDGPSYIRLVDLHVRNSYGFGIKAQGPSHHIDIVRCRVDKTFAPGIGVWNAEDLRIVGCEVTRANTQEMRLFGNRRRECPHEAISVAGVNRFEVAWNEVHHCSKEGIDVKEVSRHGAVHHNYVHDLPRQGLYADAWFGLLEDVEFYSNAVRDCEWGLVICVEGKDSELRNVRAHHNVLWRNRASGVYFGTWGTDGPRSGIVIANNTLYANGRPKHWAGPTGSIDVRSRSVRDTRVERNVCAGGGAFEIATFLDPATESHRFEELGIRIAGNLVESLKDDTAAPAQYGKPFAYAGTNAVVGVPDFVNPEGNDFRLKDGAAPSRRDAGAFAGGQDRLPAPKDSPLVGFPAFEPDVEDWPEFLMP